MRMQNEGIWVINELYKKEKIGLFIFGLRLFAINSFDRVLFGTQHGDLLCGNTFACYQAYKFCQQNYSVSGRNIQALRRGIDNGYYFYFGLNLVLGGVLGAVIGIYDLYIEVVCYG
ncbi:MAG: hypothetical protein ACLUUG_12730 [Lachnospiraceae bacterium]